MRLQRYIKLLIILLFFYFLFFQSIEEFEKWHENFVADPENPEYLNIIAKDKLKQEVEKKNNMREQQVTNDKKGNLILFTILIFQMRKNK